MDRRARLHRALDAVMDRAFDGKSLRWAGSPAPTGKYSSFSKRSWPMAHYSDGNVAAALYSDLPYSKVNAENGNAAIRITIADWSVGKTAEGRRVNGAFKYRTLVQRAGTLSQAKQMAESFVNQHPEYTP